MQTAYAELKAGYSVEDHESKPVDEIAHRRDESRIEYINYDVLDDHGWNVTDGDLIEKAAAEDLDPDDHGAFLAQPHKSLLEAAENLCGFYFIGVYLTYTSSYRVLGEELMCGVAWYFGSLMAWSIIAQTSALSATPVTVFGLPAVTALGIVLVTVGTRHVTGSDLKVQTEGGQLLVTITGAIAFGFLALYLVLSGVAGWWLFGLYLVSIPVGLALQRVMKQQYPDAFGVS